MTPAARLLVLDLDGTTLDANRALNEADVRAARALAEAGVLVTIATGRLFTGTRWVAEALGVEGSVAVMNGSERVDVASGVTRYARWLEADVRRIVRATAAEHPVGTVVFGSRRIHYCGRTEAQAPYLAIWTEDLARHPDVYEAPAWDLDEEVIAVGVVGEERDVLELARRLRADLPAEIELTRFRAPDGSSFLKIRHGAEDKGTALVRLAEERGLTAAEAVAVGDWMNDLPMLRVAGRSFAMAHAQDDVKAAAREVLEASREGGAVAEVARRVWGL
jgi:hypothetical protein